MGWRQIFHLPEEMHQRVVITLRQPKLYANKVKDAGSSAKYATHYVASNTTFTFADVNLLLGSKPHSCPLFIIGYIRE